MASNKDKDALMRELEAVNAQITRCLAMEDRLMRELEGLNSAFMPERSESGLAERRRRDREGDGSLDLMDVDVHGKITPNAQLLVKRISQLNAAIKEERRLQTKAETAVEDIKAQLPAPFTLPSLVDAMVLISNLSTDVTTSTASSPS